MALKPEHALTVGAVTGALVYGVFQVEAPNMAEISASPAHNPHIGRSVNAAGWSAAIIVAGISLLSRDPTVFVIGGTIAAGLTWRAKHAAMTSPQTGQVVIPAADPNAAGPTTSGS